MHPSEKTQRDRWRVIIPNDTSEILLYPAGAMTALPEVHVPRGERLAGYLNAELQRHWQLDVVSLFPVEPFPAPQDHTSPRYHLAELVRPAQALTQEARWAPVSSLSGRSFQEPTDFEALLCFLDRQSAGVAERAPFGHLGWFKEVAAWVQASLTPCGLRWNGRFRQFHASDSFSLLRFETNSHAVWFKAVGGPNTREFLLTEVLAQLFPHCVPARLAAQPAWNAWLAIEAQGTQLGDYFQPEPWCAVASSLAELQVQSIGRTCQLFDAGAHDLRAASLADAVDACFEVINQRMKEQTTAFPPALSESELRTLSSEIKKALSDLRQLQIPDTLGHLDFNPNNIIVSADRCMFLDWAEACVGSPFYTFAFFLEHFRRAFPQDARGERKLAACYARQWLTLISPDRISEALALAPLLAAFAYLRANGICYRHACVDDPSTAGFLRGLTRRMKREADLLSESRRQWKECSPCLGLS
jgi:hypothetical protein